jgi:hypothetical protein
MSKKVPRILVPCLPSQLIVWLLFSCQSKRAISPFPSLSIWKNILLTEIATVLRFVVYKSQRCDNPSNFHDSLSKKILFASVTSLIEKNIQRNSNSSHPRLPLVDWPLINLSYQESNTHLKPSFGLTLSKLNKESILLQGFIQAFWFKTWTTPHWPHMSLLSKEIKNNAAVIEFPTIFDQEVISLSTHTLILRTVESDWAFSIPLSFALLVKTRSQTQTMVKSSPCAPDKRKFKSPVSQRQETESAPLPRNPQQLSRLLFPNNLLLLSNRPPTLYFPVSSISNYLDLLLPRPNLPLIPCLFSPKRETSQGMKRKSSQNNNPSSLLDIKETRKRRDDFQKDKSCCHWI